MIIQQEQIILREQRIRKGSKTLKEQNQETTLILALQEVILIAKCLRQELKLQEVILKTDRATLTEITLQDHSKLSKEVKLQELARNQETVSRKERVDQLQEAGAEEEDN